MREEDAVGDLVGQAVEVLIPFAAAGGGAVAGGLASRAGSDLYDKAGRVLGKLKRRAEKEPDDESSLRMALEAALEDGALTYAELEELVAHPGVVFTHNFFSRTIVHGDLNTG